jgi:S1-C subfamily serine protease
METAIHIIIIVALTGLIIFILSLVSRKQDSGENEPADITRRKKNISVVSVASVISVLIVGSVLFYKFALHSGSAPSTPIVVTPEKAMMPSPNFNVTTLPPDSDLDVKTLPPQPPPPPLTQKETQTINALYQKIGPSVVFILTTKGNNQQVFGSGFFINYKGDIITNHHVLREANSAKIRTASGNEYEIKSILAEDVANDLVMASVNINSGDVRPLSMSASPPSIGERVIVVGSPVGLEQTVTDGIVSALRRTFHGVGKFTQISAPISPGSSGSPVVNMRGEVIGVASGMYVGNHAQNINFCSAGENIAALTPGNGYPLGRMDKPAWAIAEEKQKAEEEGQKQQQEQRKKMVADIYSMSDQAFERAKAGDNNAAFQLYEKCLSLCRQLEDNKCIGNYLRNMGVILERMGRREEAQLYYQKSSEALAKK